MRILHFGGSLCKVIFVMWITNTRDGWEAWCLGVLVILTWDWPWDGWLVHARPRWWPIGWPRFGSLPGVFIFILLHTLYLGLFLRNILALGCDKFLRELVKKNIVFYNPWLPFRRSLIACAWRIFCLYNLSRVLWFFRKAFLLVFKHWRSLLAACAIFDCRHMELGVSRKVVVVLQLFLRSRGNCYSLQNCVPLSQLSCWETNIFVSIHWWGAELGTGTWWSSTGCFLRHVLWHVMLLRLS